MASGPAPAFGVCAVPLSLCGGVGSFSLGRQRVGAANHERVRRLPSGARAARPVRLVWSCELEERPSVPAQPAAQELDAAEPQAPPAAAVQRQGVRRAEQLMRDLEAVREGRRPPRRADSPGEPTPPPPDRFQNAAEIDDAPRRVGPDADAFAAALPIVESAMLASTSAVLYAIAKVVPSPSDIAIMAGAAAPPALAAIRHGPREYLSTMVVGSIMCFTFGGPTLGFKFLLTVGPLSVVYGFGMRRKLPFVALWPAATALKTLGLFCQLQFVGVILGYDILELITTALTSITNKIAEEQGSQELVSAALVQLLLVASFASNAGAQSAMLYLGLKAVLEKLEPARNPYAEEETKRSA
eukprot:tig00000204_g17769.t1